MKLINEFLNNYGMTIIYALLTAIAGFIGTQLKKIYEEKCQEELKKKIVLTCVKAVEQMYHNLSGTEKYEKALENIQEMLEQKGIYCTELELKMLIEECVADFNEPWHEEYEKEGIA